MIYIPECIKEITGNQKYIENEVGMSESKVLMYPDYVLKIQQRSSETDNEKEIVKWLNGRIPVPQIHVYHVEGDIAYTLMSRVSGKMLCDEKYLKNPQKLIQLAADGLKLLWSVDVSDCPCTVSPLDERLKTAQLNVEEKKVDLSNVEPETFGPDGFTDPEELISWLEKNRPEEDIVMTHGDFCLPNIFVADDKISSFIDLGKMGPADRWQDIAIAIRSLHHNLSGAYNGGKAYSRFEPEMLLEKLGIDMDEEKYRYYMLLDELF